MKLNKVYLLGEIDFSVKIKEDNINQALMDVDSLVGEDNNFVEMILVKDNGEKVYVEIHNFTSAVESIYDEEEDEQIYRKEEAALNLIKAV